MLGPDLFDGTPAQLTQFKNSTGATFPLLLGGASGTGNENLFTVYGDRDNYAVINKQGVVRYNAYARWPYGNRYHLAELTGTIDSLVGSAASVGPTETTHGFALTAAPNPFHSSLALTLVNPTRGVLEARVAIYDLTGREVAVPWSAPVPPGVTRLSWNVGRSGGALTAGIYLARARIGTVNLARRAVLVP